MVYHLAASSRASPPMATACSRFTCRARGCCARPHSPPGSSASDGFHQRHHCGFQASRRDARRGLAHAARAGLAGWRYYGQQVVPERTARLICGERHRGWSWVARTLAASRASGCAPSTAGGLLLARSMRSKYSAKVMCGRPASSARTDGLVHGHGMMAATSRASTKLKPAEGTTLTSPAR